VVSSVSEREVWGSITRLSEFLAVVGEVPMASTCGSTCPNFLVVVEGGIESFLANRSQALLWRPI
jgi:hypothetical protein